MRPSPQRHALAVLRTTIGLTQKEMAALIECSTPTIQAIELGKLRLSQKLAERIGQETGVNLKWLLDNDVTQQPIETGGQPYKRASFDSQQAFLKVEGPFDCLEIHGIVLRMMADFAALLLSAYERGKARLFAYKASKAADALEKEFGINTALHDFSQSDDLRGTGACESIYSLFRHEAARLYAQQLKRDKKARLWFQWTLLQGGLERTVDLAKVEEAFPGVTKITPAVRAEVDKEFDGFGNPRRARKTETASASAPPKRGAK